MNVRKNERASRIAASADADRRGPARSRPETWTSRNSRNPTAATTPPAARSATGRTGGRSSGTRPGRTGRRLANRSRASCGTPSASCVPARRSNRSAISFRRDRRRDRGTRPRRARHEVGDRLGVEAATRPPSAPPRARPRSAFRPSMGGARPPRPRAGSASPVGTGEHRVVVAPARRKTFASDAVLEPRTEVRHVERVVEEVVDVHLGRASSSERASRAGRDDRLGPGSASRAARLLARSIGRSARMPSLRTESTATTTPDEQEDGQDDRNHLMRAASRILLPPLENATVASLAACGSTCSRSSRRSSRAAGSEPPRPCDRGGAAGRARARPPRLVDRSTSHRGRRVLRGRSRGW